MDFYIDLETERVNPSTLRVNDRIFNEDRVLLVSANPVGDDYGTTVTAVSPYGGYYVCYFVLTQRIHKVIS